MDFSYCVTGKYPTNGKQPPACYYNNDGDFIGIDYRNSATIRLIGKQYDFDANGNQLIDGPMVKGNITSMLMPPNGITEFFINDNCNDTGVIVDSDGKKIQVDDPDNLISCFKVSNSQSWSDYIKDCRAGIADQQLCQQYAKIHIVPNPPDNNIDNQNEDRWWIWLVLAILIVLIIILVLASIYVASKPRKDDVNKVQPPIIINKYVDEPNDKIIVEPKPISKAPKPIPSAPPKQVSYYRIE